MADRFYGTDVGDANAFQTVEAATSTSKAIELRISDSAYANKEAVINGVEGILQYLKTLETDPIA
jgi:hypothetical protein